MSTIEQNQSEILCKVHERTSVALLLAMLGGFLDAYTYILKNGVFANAQTGNLVLLSIAVFNGKHALIPKYALPILFFSAGILLSEFIKLNGSIKSEVRKIKLMLVFEALLLVLIGATSVHVNAAFTTCTVSFLAAIQVGMFNKLEGAAVATTMITGNLKSSMQNLHSFLRDKDKRALKRCIQYILVIVFFGIGAAGGAFLTEIFKDNSIYFCLLFLFASYALIYFGNAKNSR